MVPTKRADVYDRRFDRMFRSFQRGRGPLIVNAVMLAILIFSGGSVVFNLLSHVAGG